MHFVTIHQPIIILLYYKMFKQYFSLEIILKNIKSIAYYNIHIKYNFYILFLNTYLYTIVIIFKTNKCNKIIILCILFIYN